MSCGLAVHAVGAYSSCVMASLANRPPSTHCRPASRATRLISCLKPPSGQTSPGFGDPAPARGRVYTSFLVGTSGTVSFDTHIRYTLPARIWQNDALIPGLPRRVRNFTCESDHCFHLAPPLQRHSRNTIRRHKGNYCEHCLYLVLRRPSSSSSH